MEFLKLPKLFAATLYAIPDYQRDYEWTNIQNTTLLDDVFALFNPDEKNHFFGTIVTIPYEKDSGSNKSIDFEKYGITDFSSVKHVVDGQQRLTSFSLLAKAIVDMAKEIFEGDTDYYVGLVRKLDQMYSSQIYTTETNKASPVLILNGNTGRYYNNNVLGLTEQTCDKKLKGAK